MVDKIKKIDSESAEVKPKKATKKSKEIVADKIESAETVEYSVFDSTGKSVGKLALASRFFAAPIKKSVVQQVVRWQLAKRRAGTHKTLTKGMMKGGNRKPWKQKGTGQARSGSNTSPVWVGGGVAHGPQPRSYEFRLAKRSRVEALASVLTDKVKKGRLFVLDSISSNGKTKDFIKLTDKLGISGRKSILLVNDCDRDGKVWKSARNIKGTLTLQLSGLNTYDLLKHEYLITTKDVIEAIAKR